VIDLPDGWTTAGLAELLTEGPTNGYSPATSADARGTLSLRLSATTSGRLILNANTTKRLAEVVHQESMLWLDSGDILVQRANTIDYVGTAALFNGPPKTYIYPDLMMRIRANAAVVNAAYLWQFINSAEAKAYLRDRATGTAGNMPKINGATLRELPVLLPPLPEQQRIVHRLDALSARSRGARGELDAIARLVERLRQFVLEAAFRGDLTAAWRERNPDVEPAEELLKRIRAERRRLWEEAELAKMRARGKAPGDDQWRKRYEGPPLADVSKLPELPEGWCWASLEEARSPDTPIVYGIILPGPDVLDGVPYVRPIDMTDDGGIDFTSIKRTTAEIAQQYDRASLRTGDVILSIVGTIGKVVITPQRLDGGNITQSSVRIRPPEGLSSEYLRLALLSPQLREQYELHRFGNAVQRLNVEHVRNLFVPIAPSEEQLVLTSLLNIAFQRIPGNAISALRKQLSDFDRAIIAKAFCGELVPQDPNDEPVSTMLAQLRASPSTTSERIGQKPKRRSSSQGKAEVIMLTRRDIKDTHLSVILRERGPLTPKELWLHSQLEIDEFYDQLKDEEARGLLKENNSDAKAPRTLEVAA
jgi:type I restriction enzyme, S subunit